MSALDTLLSEREFSINAQAKINLRLKVTGRRADGYHLLSMVNTSVSLDDELLVRFNKTGAISIAVEGVVEEALKRELINPEKNLVGRAFSSFCRSFGVKYGASILLRKRIPSQAGLGGGSSDAAALLMFLHSLFHDELITDDLPQEKLWESMMFLALTLGADVPYLLKGGLAHVTGVGEVINPLPGNALEGVQCVIIHPAAKLSTPRIFGRYREMRQIFEEDSAVGGLYEGHLDLSRLIPLIDNDLRDPIFLESSRVKRTFEAVSGVGGVVVGVTGSGSALFALPSAGDRFGEGVEEGLIGVAKGCSATSYRCVLKGNPTKVDYREGL